MFLIKGGKAILGVFLAIDLDNIPIPMLGIVRDKILELFKNPMALLSK